VAALEEFEKVLAQRWVVVGHRAFIFYCSPGGGGGDVSSKIVVNYSCAAPRLAR